MNEVLIIYYKVINPINKSFKNLKFIRYLNLLNFKLNILILLNQDTPIKK